MTDHVLSSKNQSLIMHSAAVQSMIMYLAAGSPIDHVLIVEHDPLVVSHITL